MSRRRPGHGKDVAGVCSLLVVGHVRARAGEQGAQRLLELAGESRSLADLENEATWSSYDQAIALMKAAAEVLGDPQVGWHVGEELVRWVLRGPTGPTLRALGSPRAALENIDRLASKFSTAGSMEVLGTWDEHAVVAFVSRSNLYRHPLFCDYTAGLLSQIPVAFHLAPAEVKEDECEARGGRRCVYRVSWGKAEADDPPPGPKDPGAELQAVTRRLEALQAGARDLVSTDDIGTVLTCVAERAAEAVQAPRCVVALRGTDDGSVSIYEHGFSDPAEARALADELLSDDPDDSAGTRVIVEIASSSRSYGRLGVFHDEGGLFSSDDSTVVAAHACHAAAALDAAAAATEARLRSATEEVLLGLPGSLAEAAGPDDVARPMAEAVCTALRCARSAIFLWDPSEGELQARGVHGFALDFDAVVAGLSALVGGTLELGRMLMRPEPMQFDSTSDDQQVRGAMEELGITSVLAVPIMAGEEFLGVVTAIDPVEEAPKPGASPVWARLAGLANLAATALRNAELAEQVAHLAYEDGLTGLPNRRVFEDRVSQALGLARRHRKNAAVLFVDLDHFKKVNDSLGPDVGDALLCEVAGRLSETLRQSDTVARFGGDEFTVLLAEVSQTSDAAVIGQKVLDLLRQPFRIGPHELIVTPSIGIAVYPTDGETLDALLRNADAAMYNAKSQGRNTYRLYAACMNEAGGERLALQADLHAALERGQMRVFYQPQVDLRSGRIVGVEALVRWQHPVLGLLEPGEFLALAEETGLVVKLDEWVLRKACEQGAEWARSLANPVRVAVNITGRHFYDSGFVEMVEQTLRTAGLAPRLLELEVAEGVAAQEPGDVVVMLGKLRATGVTVAIDDFGTGYSALARLRHFPIDRLKIHESFVQEIVDLTSAAPIVAALIAMGHGLGIEVVAEGVETETQRTVLSGHGCDQIQGFISGAPMDAADIRAHLR